MSFNLLLTFFPPIFSTILNTWAAAPQKAGLSSTGSFLSFFFFSFRGLQLTFGWFRGIFRVGLSRKELEDYSTPRFCFNKRNLSDDFFKKQIGVFVDLLYLL